MLAMLLVVGICVGNLALGFCLAVLLGQGPPWAGKLLSRKAAKKQV